MRKKGLAGPMYSKHCGIKGLSKSAGAYYDVNGPGGSASSSFDFVMRTTADNETITIPLTGTNDCNIDWGDGNVEDFTTINPSHVYATPGDHPISISGAATRILFNGAASKSNLLEVTNLGVMNWEGIGYGISGCINLHTFIAGNTDAAPSNAQGFLNNTQSLTVLNLHGLRTEDSTDFANMFYNLTSMVDQYNITGLNFSNGLDFSSFMRNWPLCLIGPDFSQFDFTRGETFNQFMDNWGSMVTPPNLDNVVTANATTIFAMIRGWISAGEVDIGLDTWDIRNVTNMAGLASNTTLTTACYDRTLIAWSQLPVKPDVIVDFGNSKYTPGEAAEAARDILTNEPNRWVISDGGQA